MGSLTSGPPGEWGRRLSAAASGRLADATQLTPEASRRQVSMFRPEHRPQRCCLGSNCGAAGRRGTVPSGLLVRAGNRCGESFFSQHWGLFGRQTRSLYVVKVCRVGYTGQLNA